MSDTDPASSAGGTFDPLEAIALHSAGFADAAEGNLDARVEHCPEWNVADLVWHMIGVHGFWGKIAGERLSEPPDDEGRPARPPDEELVERFRTGAEQLVSTLRESDPDEHVWTWAPAQQDIAFITRHQVQEAAVHHWDAAHAAGGTVAIDAAPAADAVSEFLTFSVSSEADPADPPRPPLDGQFALESTDAGVRWTVRDGAAPGTVAFSEEPAGGSAGAAAVSGTASDILLWLYGRVELDTSDVSAELLDRFRTLCFTD